MKLAPRKTSIVLKVKTRRIKKEVSYSRRHVRWGLILTLVGIVLFVVGARPEVIQMNRSKVLGFIQLAVIEVGLGIICLGGYIAMMGFWKSTRMTIAADFGLRFVATGYLIAVVGGMADIFGLGSHPLPGIPYFGELQSAGLMVGQAIIALGLLLMLPQRGRAVDEVTSEVTTPSA